MAKKSPTERTLALLRERGFGACVVEKWNAFARVRQDAFGIGDILAYGQGHIWLVQTTTSDNRSSHHKKVVSSEHIRGWLANGGKFLLLTWSKPGKTWEPRWEEIASIVPDNTGQYRTEFRQVVKSRADITSCTLTV